MRAAWVALALALPACGDLDLQSGTLRCSIDRLCPDGYHCAGDDRCWKDGSDPAPGDMAMSIDGALPTADLSRATDGAIADLSALPDAATPADLASSRDLSTLADLATLPDLAPHDLATLPDLKPPVDAVTGASDFAVAKDLAPPVDAATASDFAAGPPDAITAATDMRLQMFGIDM